MGDAYASYRHRLTHRARTRILFKMEEIKMEVGLLSIFIGVSIALFLIILLLDDRWKMTLPLIMVNLIFITIIVYGFWNVEWIYLDAAGDIYFYSDDTHSVYSYVFVGFWFIHMLLFFKAGYDSWKDALQTKGEMSYRLQAKENRRSRKWDYQR